MLVPYVASHIRDNFSHLSIIFAEITNQCIHMRLGLSHLPWEQIDGQTDDVITIKHPHFSMRAGALINTFIPAQAKNLIFSLYTVFQIQMMACWKKKKFFFIKIVKQSLNA